MHFVNLSQRTPAALKTLGDSELLRRSVFTTPPHVYYDVNPSSSCKTQEIVSGQGVAIVNHCAKVNLLRIVNLLRHIIFSTAGSFGIVSAAPQQTEIGPEKI